MTTSHAAAVPYTLRSIQQMLGLSRVVVRGLVDAGFVTPSRGARNEYRFTFRDVVLLRTAADLQRAEIAPRKIVAALKKLKGDLPAELPLSGLRISAVGNQVTVQEGGARWQAESGQLVMDLDLVAASGGRSVAFLQHAAATTAGATGRAPAPAQARGPASASAPASARAQSNAPAAADAASWFGRAEALESRDPRGAEAAYRQALALDPAHADAYLNLGALLCESRRCGEAVKLYDQAIRRFPNEALLHFNRAVALDDLGKPADALASYNAALQLDQNLADAHYNAARLHEQLGDAKNAVRHLSAYRRLQR